MFKQLFAAFIYPLAWCGIVVLPVVLLESILTLGVPSLFGWLILVLAVITWLGISYGLYRLYIKL